MKKLTKGMIDELGNKVVELCKANGWGDTSVYFNRKCFRIGYGDYVWDENDPDDPGHYENVPVKVEEPCDPIDYFEWVNENHILSMSFEGTLYELLNYSDCPKSLWNLFESYGVYYELGNAWNLSVYPSEDMEVDGVPYKRKPEPVYISHARYDCVPELKTIMDWWYDQSAKTGNIGSCVIGAGFNFSWNGEDYFMSACSPWQGSCSWEPHVDAVKEKLAAIGATDIHYNWGVMN